MAHVKMLTRRVMVSAALMGAAAAVMTTAAAAADGCYWLGSLSGLR